MKKFNLLTVFFLIFTFANIQLYGQLPKLKDKVKKVPVTKNKDINNIIKSKTSTTTPSTTTSTTSSTGTSSSSTTTATAKSEEIPTGKDYYVSINRGTGRVASKEQPAKDLGNIIALLQPGDRVHIAGGVYKGRGKKGCDKIEMPVSIIGGYSDDFSTRDPWGAYKTIFSGDNVYNETCTETRLKIECHMKYKEYKGSITVDGIIIDNANRNYYTDDKNLKIVRKASPGAGKNNTPNTEGIRVTTGKYTAINIRNCVVMNTAHSGGAISVSAGKQSQVLIDNNLIINNTGEGIYAMSNFKTTVKTDQPSYTITNNTILFTWRYDELASNYSGNCIKTDNEIQKLAISNNVLGFGDEGGVDNINKCAGISLNNNLFTANKNYDYKEWNTKMRIDEVVDESDLMSPSSGGNISETITIPVNKEWAEVYMSRVIVSRADIDAKVSADNSEINEIRSMLGLPLQGNDVASNVSAWLHLMKTDDAIKAGLTKYKGIYGCKKP